MTIPEQKAALRRELIARRDALGRRDERSAAIAAALTALPAFLEARAIHCFLPMRSEVDTRAIVAAALAAGKLVAVPTMAPGAREMEHCWIDTLDPAAFTQGALGTPRPATMRPAQPGDWQLTVVPLLGFDRDGYRLGYGKGHYDKLLAGLACPAAGVAFADLELAALPHEPHDVPLDLIVTERELVVPRRAGG